MFDFGKRLADCEKNNRWFLDYLELQNIFSALIKKENNTFSQIETLFSQKHIDVSFRHNRNILIGLEAIKGYLRSLAQKELRTCLVSKPSWYVNFHKGIIFGGLGEMNLTTRHISIVEVAGDGKTAKGIWINPGRISFFSNENDFWKLRWIKEKYAIDFIKEDGIWKVWHFNILCYLAGSFDSHIVNNSKELTDCITLGIKDEPDDIIEENNVGEIWDVVKPPEPYETFSETF